MVKSMFDVVEEGGARLRNKYEAFMQSTAHNLYHPTTQWRSPNVEERLETTASLALLNNKEKIDET